MSSRLDRAEAGLIRHLILLELAHTEYFGGVLTSISETPNGYNHIKALTLAVGTHKTYKVLSVFK